VPDDRVGVLSGVHYGGRDRVDADVRALLRGKSASDRPVEEGVEQQHRPR
jgi:hypothetical protein